MTDLFFPDIIIETNGEKNIISCFGISGAKLGGILAEITENTETVWKILEDKYRVVFSVEGDTINIRKKIVSDLIDIFGDMLVCQGVVNPLLDAVNMLVKRGLKLSGAESCTGGLISSLITSIAGSSAFYWGGWITYSNESKSDVLGVDKEILQKYGAVSEQTVLAMADRAAEISGADISYAVSGIAGPSGGTPEKPVGTVWMAVSGKNRPGQARKFCFEGDRNIIQGNAAAVMLLYINYYLVKDY
jgi:PncC family amidohydrolase